MIDDISLESHRASKAREIVPPAALPRSESWLGSHEICQVTSAISGADQVPAMPLTSTVQHLRVSGIVHSRNAKWANGAY